MDTDSALEVAFSVILVPDEDDPSVFRAMVPGVAGCVTSLGSAQAAIEAARLAVQGLLGSLGHAERQQLLHQPPVEPRHLPRGSRIERISVRAPARPALGGRSA